MSYRELQLRLSLGLPAVVLAILFVGFLHLGCTPPLLLAPGASQHALETEPSPVPSDSPAAEGTTLRRRKPGRYVDPPEMRPETGLRNHHVQHGDAADAAAQDADGEAGAEQTASGIDASAQHVPPVDAEPLPQFSDQLKPEPVQPETLPSPPTIGGGEPAIGELTADITLSGDVSPPEDLSAVAFARHGEVRYGPGRLTNSLVYPDVPGGLFCHRPLYFEEFYLERYGRSAGIFQPAVSAAHFFVTIPAMPYKMTVRPAGRCSYVAGIGPRGQWYPLGPPRSRLRLDGALVEAGVVTGLVFILP